MLNSTVTVTGDAMRCVAQTLISMCVRDVSLTRGMTRNGRVMSFVVRYLWVRGHVEVNVTTCPVTQDDITSLLHQLKLSIWGDEADAPLSLKLAQLDTLVERAVVYSNAGACVVTPSVWCVYVCEVCGCG